MADEDPNPDETDRSSGPIPEDWKQRLVDSIKKVGVRDSGTCKRCGQQRMTIAPDIVSSIVWRGGVVIGETAYPQAMIVCTNCGFTDYYNLVALGVLKTDTDEGGEDG